MIKLEHSLSGKGLDWVAPVHLDWQDQSYSLVSAILHQPHHWSSRIIVDGRLYSGQDCISNMDGPGWTGILRQCPDLENQLRISPPESLVRLCYVRDAIGTEGAAYTSQWFPLYEQLPQTPVQTPTISSTPLISPQKRPHDDSFDSLLESPPKKCRGEDGKNQEDAE
jgi:hypothetical protein